ncbi:MAG: DUF86 domain-containing protein [Chlamydiae bacterium]|nr:DUF86 domain-containing protein [Chlamydiota bacterium]
MIKQDVLYQKINSIQNYLQRIHTTVGNDPQRLHEWDVQDIVVLNLQRATQLTMDLASYVVACYRLGVPQSLKEVFSLLEHNHFIDHTICEKMQKMVGFRNIAVHAYQTLDIEILKSVVIHHLKDFEVFYSAVLKKIAS